MPRVSTHKCQGRSAKAMRCCKCSDGIIKGDEYYQWAIKSQRGGTVYRQHAKHGSVRQSQLTHSKMSGAYAAIEGVEDAMRTAETCEDVAEALRGASSDIESVRDEYQESLDNMPEQLQQGDTGQQIQEKIDGLDEFAQNLNDAADECEGMHEDVEEPEEGEEPDEEQDGGLQNAIERAEEALGELNV